MTEREASQPGSPERMAHTADRFQDWIIEGITGAQEGHREIDLMTARLIAQVLGRAVGRESALADFGRAGEGTYEALRDEYLLIYGDPSTPPVIREWIDWLGTYLVERENHGSGRRFMNEHAAPKLEQLLVKTSLEVAGIRRLVHLPANLASAEQAAVSVRLNDGPESGNPAFWTYLGLPDVSASSPDLLESFYENYVGEFATIEEALYGLVELEEWETDLHNFADDRGIDPNAVTLDHGVIERQTRELYDLIERSGVIHAFLR